MFFYTLYLNRSFAGAYAERELKNKMIRVRFPAGVQGFKELSLKPFLFFGK